MVVQTANEYLASELVNRVKYLQEAINQAEKIIFSLENENKRLQDVLNGLTSICNEDHAIDRDILNDSVCETV